MALLLRAFSHFLVDGVCAAAVFGILAPAMEPAALAWAIALYNLIAFSMQALAGLFIDRLGGTWLRYVLAASCLLTAAAFFAPLPPFIRAALLGAGNCLFHTSGGACTLRVSRTNPAPLGVFVAPGSFGLALGTLFPHAAGMASAFLFPAAAAGLLFVHEAEEAPCSSRCAPEVDMIARTRAFAAVLLALAVAVRAFSGGFVRFEWKSSAVAALTLAFFVMLGKGAGGYLAGRVGISRAAMLSCGTAIVLVPFFQHSAVLSILGQFALNLMMPLTLALMYRTLPHSPGFAFGLAASVLYPAQLLGGYAVLPAAAARAALAAAIALSLAAVLICAHFLPATNERSDPVCIRS